MKITHVTAIIPEAFGLAMVGAAIGAFAFGADAVGVTTSVLAGAAAGAAAASLIVLGLRIRSARKTYRAQPSVRPAERPQTAGQVPP